MQVSFESNEGGRMGRGWRGWGKMGHDGMPGFDSESEEESSEDEDEDEDETARRFLFLVRFLAACVFAGGGAIEKRQVADVDTDEEDGGGIGGWPHHASGT